MEPLCRGHGNFIHNTQIGYWLNTFPPSDYFFFQIGQEDFTGYYITLRVKTQSTQNLVLISQYLLVWSLQRNIALRYHLYALRWECWHFEEIFLVGCMKAAILRASKLSTISIRCNFMNFFRVPMALQKSGNFGNPQAIWNFVKKSDKTQRTPSWFRQFSVEIVALINRCGG